MNQKFVNILKEENLLIEMATIGDYSGYKIMVYTEPYGNPSFHLKYKNDWEVVLEIEGFEILEVKSGIFKKGEFLPNNILKPLKKWLLEANVILPEINNLKMILTQWCILNPKYKINTNLTLNMLTKQTG